MAITQEELAQSKQFHDTLRGAYDSFDAGAGMKAQALVDLMNNPQVPQSAIDQAAKNMGIDPNEAQALADNYQANRDYISNVREAGAGGNYQQYEPPKNVQRDTAAAIRTSPEGNDSARREGESSTEWLTRIMTDQYGVLDPDGYTEDRADKQSVDEFMDLFQPADQAGTDTPPQWAIDSGAAGNWKEDAVIAGSGGLPANLPPGGGGGVPGGGGGGGPPDPFQPPPMNAPPVNWQNYSDSQSGNEDFYAQQAQALKGQNADLMGRQYAAQQSRDTQDAARNAEAAARREAGPVDPWAWADLPDPPQAFFAGEDGEPGYTWGFAPGVEAGMTNAQLAAIVGGNMPQPEQEWLMKGMSDDQQVQFASGDHMDPDYYRQRLGGEELSDNWRGALNSLLDATYKRSDLQTPLGGGPTAAQGYALPIGTRTASGD